MEITKEFGVIKITEDWNGKSVLVPDGYRLSIILWAKWYLSPRLAIVGDIRLLGIPMREEPIVRQQFLVFTYAISGPGEITIDYVRPNFEKNVFTVQVIRGEIHE